MTKKLLFLVLSISLGNVLLQAADLQQAEENYRQGHFATALGQYEQLLQLYPNDPNLYYNIGNCYFKMGSKGLATANYYRAFKLDPRDADIRHNLSLSLQTSGERFVPSGMPEVLHKAFFWLTQSELQGLLYIAFWLVCTFVAIWLFKRRFGRFTLLLLIVFAGLTGWYLWRQPLDNATLAVVAVPVAELRSGPGENFPASANIAQGHLLILEDSKDHWQQVVVKSQGIKGWMQNNSLEKI